jgi:hypothetical protein
MNTAQLLNDIEQLPLEAQQKIEAFIISMKELYQLNTPKAKQKQPLLYKKRNVKTHTKLIKKEFDENLCDDIALTHIQNSADYIHNLRRQHSE